MKKHLNHSRYLDYGAKDTGDFSYYRAKQTPTYKQIKFYKSLYARCKEHNIDPKVGEHPVTRMDFTLTIDKLIKKLQENGIEAHSSDKDVTCVVTHGQDHQGRYYTSERIVVKEREQDGD